MQGEGEPLMSVMPCVAKHAVDPPLQPATPRVVDFDRKWAKLEWWAPSGSDIKHYVVEKREIFLVPKESGEEENSGADAGGEGDETAEETAEEKAQSAAVAALIAGVYSFKLLFESLLNFTFWLYAFENFFSSTSFLCHFAILATDRFLAF